MCRRHACDIEYEEIICTNEKQKKKKNRIKSTLITCNIIELLCNLFFKHSHVLHLEKVVVNENDFN